LFDRFVEKSESCRHSQSLDEHLSRIKQLFSQKSKSQIDDHPCLTVQDPCPVLSPVMPAWSVPLERSASLSADRRYRYRLGRRWGSGPALAWIMLNPSAADGAGDDPTTRRVISFSRSWGYSACVVVNLFAYRCADPAELRVAAEPIGRRNVSAVRAAIDDAAGSGGDRVVIGWGVHGQRWLTADGDVARRLRQVVASATERWTQRALCPVTLGTTIGGAPRHPLYVRSSSGLEPLAPTALTATR
jgi:hypothetical protein